MQQVKSKGTILSVYTGAGYTAIAQVISLDLPEMETETYEADFLSNTSPGRRNARPGNHRQLAGIGAQLIEQAILAASADDADLGQLPATQLLQLLLV